MKKIPYFFLLILAILGCQDATEETKKEDYLFKKLASSETGIDFSNQITEDPEHSIINYIYYYNGAGVAAGDVNNDGLTDLYFVSNMDQNRLYLNKGNLKFEDVTEKANVGGSASWNTGATMVDINNDGLLDIYVCAVSDLLDFTGHNELYINNGDGTFSEESEAYGLDFKGYSTQAYFFDYDKDLDLDVYIVNHAVHTTLSHGEADVRSKREPLVGDVLLKNENGKFMDASEEAGIYGGVNGYGLSASLADFNNDGWDDIYVANDFHEDDYYYLNNQDGTFREVLSEAFSTISRFSMGSDAADINGDGYQDLITLDMLPKDEKVIKESEGDDAMYNMQKRLDRLGYKDQYARNMLQINNYGEYFTETALLNDIAATDWSWGPLLADYNNDGHTDLFIANGILRRPNDLDFKKFVSNAFKNNSTGDGVEWLYRSKDTMPEGKVTNEIFRGNSEGFQIKTGEWIPDEPSLSNGTIYTDLDLDGDLDLVLNNLNERGIVYENTTNANANSLSLDFEYQGANKNGIGTKAIVFSNGKKQLKQLFRSRGFLSSTDSKLHFGLGENTVDSIQVIWPDNTYQSLISPELNTVIEVVYSGDTRPYNYDSKPEAIKEFEAVDKIDFVHKEDTYDDFLNEKLIPYKVSTMGPAMATGDIDKNGFEDLFLGNSSGNTAAIYLNDGKNFRRKEYPVFVQDSLYEDNAAVFFDADNDDDLDLYVASGINKLGKGQLMLDRLYINQNGIFIEAIGRIPEIPLTGTVVVAADYDQDGDQDLFLGNISNPGNFGQSVPSVILRNDGTGNFSIDTQFTLNSHVTDARWEDLDGNGYPDLLVSAEWDAPKIYFNTNGKLSPAALPGNLAGLWQSVETHDIDADGDKDVLVGNWGLNTRFKPTPESPLRMYHADFNSDGIFETVLAYNRDGKYYPVSSRDELISQMNFLSKKYPSHESFSMQTMEDIFTKEVLNNSMIYQITNLASGYLENDGKNNFSAFREFPVELQVAPINSFSKIKLKGEELVLVSGNSFKVDTYHGGYSSLKGILVKDLSHYRNVSEAGIAPFNEEIRKTASIPMKDEMLLIVLPNDGQLKTYSFSKEE